MDFDVFDPCRIGWSGIPVTDECFVWCVSGQCRVCKIIAWMTGDTFGASKFDTDPK
jgi:hypothetical protein